MFKNLQVKITDLSQVVPGYFCIFRVENKRLNRNFSVSWTLFICQVEPKLNNTTKFNFAGYPVFCVC